MTEHGVVTTMEHCLLELVLNSLKAEASAISIRIDSANQKLQVTDNGSGVTKNALRYLGEFFAKSKDKVRASRKTIITKGSLVKIREISSFLIFRSRSRFATETYEKIFSDAKISEVREIEKRSSCGTTVIFYAAKEFRKWNKKLDLFTIKLIIMYLSLVNSQVAFSVSDDTSGNILLKVVPNEDPRRLLTVISGCLNDSCQVRQMKTQVFDTFKISGFWGLHTTDSSTIQQLFLNLRPVHCPAVQKFTTKIISKICCSRAENEIDLRDDLRFKDIFFLLYVECPDSEYSLCVDDDKLTVDFHRIDEILESIEKCFNKTATTDFKYPNTDVCESKDSPMIHRSLKQIFGSKPKRSFFTKIIRRNLPRPVSSTVVKKKVKFLTKIVKPARYRRKECRVEIREAVSSEPQPTGRESSLPTKGHDNDGSQIFLASRERMEEPKCDDIKLLKTETITSRCIESYSQKNECEERIISDVRETCFERSQQDGSKVLHIRIESLASSVVAVEDDYDNFVSRVSDKLIENYLDTRQPSIKMQQSSRSNNSETTEKNSKIPTNIEQRVQTHKDIGATVKKSKGKIAEEILPVITEYQYDNHGVSWISQKCNEKASNRTDEIIDIDCSQWSDWIYEPQTENHFGEKGNEAARPVVYQRFRFLPLNLHALLPFLNEKLIHRDFSEDVGLSVKLKFNIRRQDLDVRPCTRRSLEFRLKNESLRSMKVLNQVNREMIVALTEQDSTKLIVVVDQHAMHERIRYENLLRAYKRAQKNEQYMSVALHRPIIITDFDPSTCDLLSSNQTLLTRFGMNLAFRSESTLLVFGVPQCFVKKTFRTNSREVEIAVRKFLQEVVNNLVTNGTRNFFPRTIHDAIASEACHGAIKFGDPLTLEQCEGLISCWKETDAPNRCAHGRPSVVPLLELSAHRTKRHETVCKGNLNFRGLKKFRRATGNRRVDTSRYHPYVASHGRTAKSDFNDFVEALR